MNCTHCGANLTADDMRMTNCRFCGTVLAHHARAMEKVAVVQGLLGDANGNGIPDALEGMIAPGMMPPRAGSPVGGFGMGPPPGGAVVITSGSAVVLGGPAPPMTGGPVGFAGAPAYQAAEHARRGVRNMMVLIIVFAVALPLLIAGISVAIFVLAR